MGLPLSHVFSGRPSSGVAITTDTGRRWDTPIGYRAGSGAPILIIAPHSTVGTTLDLRQHFPALRGAGRFRIAWEPYKGAVKSEIATITIATRKRAEVVTDDGTMTLQFFYEEAPNHVANFIELALAGFYNGKTFHRLESGYFILGGCPRGDGTGIRPDGKRIAEEFNNHPHEKGSVSMALLGDDPDSGSCQFFICNTRQKDWDGRFTVFAHLVGEESFETLDHLMATPVDDLSRPVRTLYIRSVHIIDEPSDTSSDAP
ncbi:MAG: peptidylprolyl isomerase [Planctomycetes bacterium]|nr:peptidylprolyl isomerase [Planctomycetota bacterium]